MFPLYDHNPTKRMPVFTILFILLNVLVQWKMSQLTDVTAVKVICERGFISNRLTRLDNPQPLVVTVELDGAQNPPQQRRFRQQRFPPPAPAPRTVQVQLSTDSGAVFLTLLTMMFLHGGWFHLISNMWMLWIFGNNIEDRLGHIVFIAFYLLGGVLSTLAQWTTNPVSETPMVGASGAVAATLGAYAITFPWAKVKTLVFVGIPLLLDMPALVVLGVWLIFETVMGFAVLQMPMEAGVAHWAHIGGFVAGACIMPLLSIGSDPTDTDWRGEVNEQFDFSGGKASTVGPKEQPQPAQPPQPDRRDLRHLDDDSPFQDFSDPRFR